MLGVKSAAPLPHATNGMSVMSAECVVTVGGINSSSVKLSKVVQKSDSVVTSLANSGRGPTGLHHHSQYWQSCFRALPTLHQVPPPVLPRPPRQGSSLVPCHTGICAQMGQELTECHGEQQQRDAPATTRVCVLSVSVSVSVATLGCALARAAAAALLRFLSSSTLAGTTATACWQQRPILASYTGAAARMAASGKLHAVLHQTTRLGPESSVWQRVPPIALLHEPPVRQPKRDVAEHEP